MFSLSDLFARLIAALVVAKRGAKVTLLAEAGTRAGTRGRGFLGSSFLCCGHLVAALGVGRISLRAVVPRLRVQHSQHGFLLIPFKTLHGLHICHGDLQRRMKIVDLSSRPLEFLGFANGARHIFTVAALRAPLLGEFAARWSPHIFAARECNVANRDTLERFGKLLLLRCSALRDGQQFTFSGFLPGKQRVASSDELFGADKHAHVVPVHLRQCFVHVADGDAQCRAVQHYVLSRFGGQIFRVVEARPLDLAQLLGNVTSEGAPLAGRRAHKRSARAVDFVDVLCRDAIAHGRPLPHALHALRGGEPSGAVLFITIHGERIILVVVEFVGAECAVCCLVVVVVVLGFHLEHHIFIVLPLVLVVDADRGGGLHARQGSPREEFAPGLANSGHGTFDVQVHHFHRRFVRVGVRYRCCSHSGSHLVGIERSIVEILFKDGREQLPVLGAIDLGEPEVGGTTAVDTRTLPVIGVLVVGAARQFRSTQHTQYLQHLDGFIGGRNFAYGRIQCIGAASGMRVEPYLRIGRDAPFRITTSRAVVTVQPGQRGVHRIIFRHDFALRLRHGRVAIETCIHPWHAHAVF